MEDGGRGRCREVEGGIGKRVEEGEGGGLSTKQSGGRGRWRFEYEAKWRKGKAEGEWRKRKVLASEGWSMEESGGWKKV